MKKKILKDMEWIGTQKKKKEILQKTLASSEQTYAKYIVEEKVFFNVWLNIVIKCNGFV